MHNWPVLETVPKFHLSVCFCRHSPSFWDFHLQKPDFKGLSACSWQAKQQVVSGIGQYMRNTVSLGAIPVPSPFAGSREQAALRFAIWAMEEGATGAKSVLAQINSLRYNTRQSQWHKHEVYTSTRFRSQLRAGLNSLQLHLHFPFGFRSLLVIGSTYRREQHAPRYLDLPFYL